MRRHWWSSRCSHGHAASSPRGRTSASSSCSSASDIAGIVNASWLSIPIGAMLLLLLGWSRYRDLFARAGKVDADWRELGALARMHNLGSGVGYYLKSHSLLLVLAAKLLHDSLFLAGAFLFGHAIAWLWGTR